MIMRIKLAKFVAFFIVFVNIVVVYFTLKLFLSFNPAGVANPPGGAVRVKQSVVKPALKHFHNVVSIVFREFELHENDVTQTVKSFTASFPNIQVYIICDYLPYPPLELTFWNATIKNVKIINLAPNLRYAFIEQYPLVYIKTKYVLFVPDSTRLPNRQTLQLLLTVLTKQPEVAIAAPVGYKTLLNCLKVNASSRTWVLKYENAPQGELCDAIAGKHVVLLETDVLKRLPNAFLLPFPQALYLQTAALDLKIKIFKESTLTDGKPVLKSHHSQWKKQQTETERRKILYNTFKFKQVILENGAIEWYGCTRDTPRCFPPVVDSMPSYLYEKRWTPPCCLANLRRTARHVFNCLDDAGVRYWLENGSLLGAMRSADVLPWDYDVDVGVYRDDVRKSLWLEKAKTKPVIDSKGFVWEKATEGNFFRVHFSKANRIHVNVFPFLLRNGTMVRDGWFTSHRNVEFSDRYLHPMSSIEFLGRHVPCPNNVGDFLEMKYGRGAIERPRYPDPNRLKYP